MSGTWLGCGSGRPVSEVVVALASIALLGCAGDSAPQVVSLADLVGEQDVYDGSTVSAEGTVQTHDQPRHYWIEDAQQHRVELFPHDAVADLVGQRVRVTGRFTFRDDRGRGIDIDELEVVGETPTAQAGSVDGGGGSSDPWCDHEGSGSVPKTERAASTRSKAVFNSTSACAADTYQMPRPVTQTPWSMSVRDSSA